MDYQLKSNHPACLREGCKRDTYGGSRGLCTSHYAVLQSLVKRGRTTWEQLEADGRALPKKTKEDIKKLKELQGNLKRVWSSELQKFVFVDKDLAPKL